MVIVYGQHVGPRRKWSQVVTRTSGALDVEEGLFTLNDPDAIAKSLLESARRSSRRKASPYRSAVSMLNFYINRAGKNLSDERRSVLEQAKVSLRDMRRDEDDLP